MLSRKCKAAVRVLRRFAGLLYLLSCLAKYDDMRAEMEAAGAVDVLLELLGSCHDTKVQARPQSDCAECTVLESSFLCTHITSDALPNYALRDQDLHICGQEFCKPS